MIGKNNPLNIRYSPLNRWKGLVGNKKGFCEFSELYYGLRACFILISRSYRKKGAITYQQIIDRYAPVCENNTADYVAFVCHWCCVLPFDVPETDDDWCDLIYSMSFYEGNPVSKAAINKFFNEFKKRG